MASRGIIEPSSSAWCSPVVMVTKKKDQNIRFCIDFRKINDITEKDCQPIPRIEDSWAFKRQSEGKEGKSRSAREKHQLMFANLRPMKIILNQRIGVVKTRSMKSHQLDQQKPSSSSPMHDEKFVEIDFDLENEQENDPTAPDVRGKSQEDLEKFKRDEMPKKIKLVDNNGMRLKLHLDSSSSSTTSSGSALAHPSSSGTVKKSTPASMSQKAENVPVEPLDTEIEPIRNVEFSAKTNWWKPSYNPLQDTQENTYSQRWRDEGRDK
ncbi:unnamed protein product [Mytilus coruscus]|uniref:Uncharacterized protein n=1 Tax=Mytilus coruscus TaxID=42192 RepID=A0A6J8EXD1_MYTCO|nr:unnamed protein product [Mytilus coruscus]